jgi:hypothetical protein
MTDLDRPHGISAPRWPRPSKAVCPIRSRPPNSHSASPPMSERSDKEPLGKTSSNFLESCQPSIASFLDKARGPYCVEPFAAVRFLEIWPKCPISRNCGASL